MLVDSYHNYQVATYRDLTAFWWNPLRLVLDSKLEWPALFAWQYLSCYLLYPEAILSAYLTGLHEIAIPSKDPYNIYTSFLINRKYLQKVRQVRGWSALEFLSKLHNTENNEKLMKKLSENIFGG